MDRALFPLLSSDFQLKISVFNSHQLKLVFLDHLHVACGKQNGASQYNQQTENSVSKWKQQEESNFYL